MIKLSSLKSTQGRIVRETTAPFTTFDKKAGGSETTEDIRVRYYSLSVRESKEFQTKIKEATDLYLSDVLASVIESLPDIVDEKGQPIKVTADVLEDFNSINLRSIQKAIEADIAGK